MNRESSLYWEVTNKGRTLALASAAQPILRKTAERKISELLERVKIINTSPRYLFEVTKVIVFGSYLTEKQKINDIDIAVTLERKEADNNKFEI